MNLKIKFVPYEKFKKNGGRLLKDIQENTILLIDAKISSEEEAYVIEETMRKVSDRFSGVEMSSLEMGSKAANVLGMIRNALIERILGKKRGITIIGPAKVVRKIKKNPEDLLLYM
jgi:hypothetical protein